MKIATILAGTAVASLAIFADIGLPFGVSTIQTAQAQATISFSVFYNDLADHGDWVRYRDDYVFIPAKVERGWRPYTEGHWVYANDYGWTWASDEPFGWATYHYGRWGYADELGWYWVPGTRWAPAWVSWRRSDDHVVWAPLPPRRDADVSIEISVGDIPDFYWVAVPTRSFLEIDLRRDIIRNDRDRRRIVERTEFIGTPRVQNNIVINTVIDIDIIQKETGRKVRRVNVRKSNDPREARATDEQVTVFEGEVKAESDAKPKRVKKVEEVAKVTREDNTEQTDVQQTQDKAVPDNDADQANDSTKTKKKNQAGAEDSPNVNPDDAVVNQAGEANSKKKRRQPVQAESPATGSENGKDSQAEAPVNKKKARKAKADANAEQPQEQASQPQKKKQQNAAEEDVTTGSADKVDRANNGKNKNKANRSERANKGKKKQECDPGTDPNCGAQQ